MIRFAVLNEEEQPRTKDDESVEIQAEKSLGIYESAIRLLQKGQVEESTRMLKNLIESDIMQKFDANSEVAARGTPLCRLQYLVYTNYAQILEEGSDERTALQYYLKAITFDVSDNSLWAKIGSLAAKEKNLKLARYALECALQQSRPEETEPIASAGIAIDQGLTPTQWNCLETLCEVLHDIGDFLACEEYIQKALKLSPYFERGLQLLDLIRNRAVEPFQDISDVTNEKILRECGINDEPKELHLDELSWLNLGESLIEEYKAFLEVPERDFYNQRILIRVNKTQSEDVEMPQESPVPQQSETNKIEAVVEDSMLVDPKVAADPLGGDITEQNPLVNSKSDDSGDQADKEGGENEQNAAIKRKKREAEERPGLRTSKRVRDKLEQFEETKRKREEEEHEILAKYRLILSRFGLDMENAYVSCSKSDSLQQDQIFPNGIGGLLVTFNKHLERPNALVQASSIEHVQQQKTNHFAIFNTEKIEPIIDPYFENDVILLDFINKTNEQNSGILTYLCEFIIAVMFRGTTSTSNPNWQKKWPVGLRHVVNRMVFLIEDQLHDYLRHENWIDELSIYSEQTTKLELSLSICEMYLDEMVQATLQSFTLVSRRNRSSKRVDTESVAKLEKHLQRWMYYVSFELEISPSHTKDLSQSALPSKRAASLRFNWILGRYSQCLGNAAEAIAKFEDCAQIHKSDPLLSIELPNCKYDTRIDAEKIQERLSLLKMHQYVLDAARLFEEKDYGAVITRLEPIFLKKGESNTEPFRINDEPMDSGIADTIGGSLSERLELMNLLYKSCEALKDRTHQLHCITEMFVLVAETLVNTVTEKSEATEVWFLFSQVSQTLYMLRETLQSTSLDFLLSSLEVRLLQRLVCCVLAIARLGFVNILHQDRLVDDDIKLSYSDLLKNRPHLEQFNLILVRVWLILLLLLPAWICDEPDRLISEANAEDRSEKFPLNTKPLDILTLDLDSETVNRILSQPLTSNSVTPVECYSEPSRELYMELIALVHDDLGVRGICGIDDNQLIKLALKASSPMQGEFYRREENQCYYCFYGISLSVDGQYPIEHSSEPVDFDRTAAIEFFPLLERSLSDKALRGQVRGDLKDAVDRVEEALGSPPYESNSYLEMNRQIIDNYLASDINFAEAIHLTLKNELPTMLQPPSSKLPPVYRRIYAIQGKIFLAQFRNKAKNNQFKPLEDLQHAIDQFKTDIHVNPDCWESWYSLAICYTFLADENLVFSASDIRNNFSKITELQKRSFHCFSQAVRLTPRRIQDESDNDINSHDVESQPGDDGTIWDTTTNRVNSRVERDSSEDRGPQHSEESGGGERQLDTVNTNSYQEWRRTQATFWFDFGNLVHGIMSKPMRMEAMRRSGGLETLSEEGGPKIIHIPEPTEEQVYKFAAFCFKRSLMLNEQNWQTPLMLGKCIEKLNGRPSKVLALYKMAADKVPHRSGHPGNEKIFEATYKLISTLSKYLAHDKIMPSVVENLMTKTLAKVKLVAADGESFIFEPPKEYLEIIEQTPPDELDIHRKEKLNAFRLLCEGLARIRHTDKRHWHHRPVFRQAWILYDVYHDIERAKLSMLSLFQIKSNLKTLVSSVWKPEFERSGKHFVYVGEYTKFLIVLAKESNDVETLNSLARKIRRATGLLLDLKEIWELLYDSYLSVLSGLVGPPPALAVAEVIPRTEFREKAPVYEARMFDQASKLPGLTVLQRLCELKKLNDKMAPEGEMGQLLAVCYSKLFIEVGGAELYPKELVRQLSGNSEPIAVIQPGLNAETSSRVDTINTSESTLDNKRALQDEDEDNHEDIRLKMLKLTGETQEGTEVTSVMIETTSNITVEIPMKSKGDSSEGERNSEEKDQRASNTETMTSGSAEAPLSPGVCTNTKEGEGSMNIDLEPDIDDWKNRKKISAAELASRATIMCKTPPALVTQKTPQNLQSKVAGADSQVNQEESSIANEDSGDVAMVDTRKATEEESRNQDKTGDIEMEEAEEQIEANSDEDELGNNSNSTNQVEKTSNLRIGDRDGSEQIGEDKLEQTQGENNGSNPEESRGSRIQSKRQRSGRLNSKIEEDLVIP